MPRLARSALFLVCLSIPVFSARAQQLPPVDSASRVQALQRAMERMRAGPEHSVLRQLVGDWDQSARYASSGTAAEVMKGRAAVREILDGRFIVIEATHGGPQLTVDAVTVIGFDRRFHRFTYIGFDSFGTYYVTASGLMEADSATIRMTGEDRQPSGAVKKYEMVLKLSAKDTFVTQIYFFMDDGSKHLAVETTHRRRSAGG